MEIVQSYGSQNWSTWCIHQSTYSNGIDSATQTIKQHQRDWKKHFYNSPFYEIFTKVRTVLIYPEDQHLVSFFCCKYWNFDHKYPTDDFFSFLVLMDYGVLLCVEIFLLKSWRLKRPGIWNTPWTMSAHFRINSAILSTINSEMCTQLQLKAFRFEMLC